MFAFIAKIKLIEIYSTVVIGGNVWNFGVFADLVNKNTNISAMFSRGTQPLNFSIDTKYKLK